MHHTGKEGGTYFPRPLPEGVAIGGLDVAVGLDQRLPLLHHGPQLVSGQAHAVEVGEAVLALKRKNSSKRLKKSSLSGSDDTRGSA